MKKVILLFIFAVAILVVNAQSDVDKVLKDLKENINSLESLIDSSESVNTVAPVVNASIPLSYPSPRVGLELSFFLNSTDYVSPIAFFHMGESVSGLGFGISVFEKEKTLGLKSINSVFQTDVKLDKFNTNEYQVSINTNYNLSVGKFINAGAFLDLGIYSEGSFDSLMSPYLSGGIELNAFFLHGASSLTYSDDLPYTSLYKIVGVKNMIPVYEFGLKTPQFKMGGKLLLESKVVYENYLINNPIVYQYNSSGQIEEDVSKRVNSDRISFYASVLCDKGSFKVGVSTWNTDKYLIELSAKIKIGG